MFKPLAICRLIGTFSMVLACGIPALATDCDALMDEFFARYFGAAGDPLKKFYLRIEQINQTEGVLGTNQQVSWGKLGTAARMGELEGYIDQALALSANASPAIQQRVNTWKSGVWDYMKAGFDAYAAR